MDQLRKISLIGLAFLLLSITITGIASGQNEMPDEVTWFFGLGAAVCAVVVIFWFVIWILVAIWVYRDAEKRGSSGVLWLLIIIILGIIGIIIWLVVRPPIGGHPKEQASGRICPNCGRPIPMDARVCPYCGKQFESFLK